MSNFNTASPALPPTDLPPDLESARLRIQAWRQAALARGLDLDSALRRPPPEPTTCCGKGCNGCVWEGFYGALLFWQEDAQALLQGLPLGLSTLDGHAPKSEEPPEPEKLAD